MELCLLFEEEDSLQSFLKQIALLGDTQGQNIYNLGFLCMQIQRAIEIAQTEVTNKNVPQSNQLNNNEF